MLEIGLGEKMTKLLVCVDLDDQALDLETAKLKQFDFNYYKHVIYVHAFKKLAYVKELD